jgi:acyl carrier protein
MYGPTEGTCGATIKRLRPGQPVTIGKPNPTTRIYIMSENRTLVPPGVIGEIFLAGVQVARGYIGLPKLTAERFMADPICPIGEYMYRTGDRGYWNEDGEVVCLGRNDREVKLRGFRLDMNDLEIRIARAEPTLQAAAVLVHNEQLMSVVQPANIDIPTLQSTLLRALAPHQRPARIVAVDKMPSTQAGKTDYAALIKLLSVPQNTREEQRTTPVSLTMRRVIVVVRSILQLNQSVYIGAEASFDELGGTSLKQVALCSRLSKEFGVQVPLRLIIERPRLSAIADAIDVMLSSSQDHRSGPCRTIGEQKASPGEIEWFEKYQLDVGTSAFNVFYAATFSPVEISRKRLTEAWNVVLSRHAILRSRYAKKRGNRVAHLLSNCAPRAQAVSGLSFWTEANRPFYVVNNDPIRVLIGQDSMMVVISHIIADFTALAILLDEVNLVYTGRMLPPIIKTYDEADVWFKEAPMCYKTWWLEYLASLPSEPAILKHEQERKSYHGTSIVSKMPQSLYRNMRRLTDSTRLSMQQLVLAAVALVLACGDRDDDGKIDVLLGSPYMNRPTDDDLSVVGLYLEPLPIRIAYPSPAKTITQTCNEKEAHAEHEGHVEQEDTQSIVQDGSSASYLETVRQSSQMALAHAMPWHQLLELIGSDTAYPSHPLFDIMVSFHESSQTEKIGQIIPGVKPCFAWSEGSKFKLMVEFSAFGEEVLMMRLEHDTEVFEAKEMYRLERMIPMALEILTDYGRDTKVDSIIRELRGVEGGLKSATVLNAEEVFGKSIAEL